MKKLLALVALFTILSDRNVFVQSQCFTDNDRFNVILQTDLSPMTDFGLNLFKEFVLMQDGNVFFSPYSIWSALNLAYFGAGGETERQLQDALGHEGKIEALRIWKALELTYYLRSQIGANYVFNLANRIYVDNKLPFRNCTKTLLKNEVKHIDFQNKGSSVTEINDFVSKTTNGQITDLLDSEALSDALMVLVNAAYFKGTWETKFKASLTGDAVFKSDKGESKVKMMSHTMKLRYGQSSQLGVQMLELPYEGNVISMYILLPVTPGEEALGNVTESLQGSLLSDAMLNMTTTNVHVKLPRFKIESKLERELTQGLQNLGVTDLFNQTASNLTRFVEGVKLSADKAVHKAFVKVGEEGTEAAAATAFVINTRLGIPRPLNLVQFYCNRPFIFYLYDNDIKNILFLGVYKEPQ